LNRSSRIIAGLAAGVTAGALVTSALAASRGDSATPSLIVGLSAALVLLGILERKSRAF
jgi:hypothetical protein